ncbi:MAG: hypothetical protein ACM3PU_05295 [Gemmatimonadota bacterium]
MPYFRVLLFLFAAAVVTCAVLYLWSGDRKYLRWAGRVFGLGLGAAVLFFTVLLIQRLA